MRGPMVAATARKGEETRCGVACTVTGLRPGWLAGPRLGHGEEKGNRTLLGLGEEKGMGQWLPGEREVRWEGDLGQAKMTCWAKYRERRREE